MNATKSNIKEKVIGRTPKGYITFHPYGEKPPPPAIGLLPNVGCVFLLSDEIKSMTNFIFIALKLGVSIETRGDLV